VIVPSYSFIATANSVVHCGATPVFVDIDPAIYNIDPQAAEAAVTSRDLGLTAFQQSLSSWTGNKRKPIE
jgi:perosamine synthetase